MYMLDTYTSIVVLTEQPGNLMKLLASRRAGGLCISSITLGELEYNEEGSPGEKKRISLDTFLKTVCVKEFDQTAAFEYGKIKRVLKKRNSMLKPLNLLVGAHAKSLGLTLITGNPGDFAPIPGLKTEDWF